MAYVGSSPSSSHMLYVLSAVMWLHIHCSKWALPGQHGRWLVLTCMQSIVLFVCEGGIQGRNMLFYWSRKPGFLTPVFMLDTIPGRTVKLSTSTTTPTCVLSPRRGLSVGTLLQSAGMAHKHVTLQSEHEEHLRLRPRLPFINRWPLSDKLCNSVTREDHSLIPPVSLRRLHFLL